VTPAELPAYLEGIKARVEAAAIPVANAIAETYKEHLVGYTLHESGSHAPVTRTPAPPGRPPAFMTGGLAASVTKTPATGGGGVAWSYVAPHTIYASTQEYGGVHIGKPFMWLWVRYIGPMAVMDRGWLRRTVDIPARPYMSTAVSETVANGSLTRAAMESFEAAVWGG
jgi:hypothetical protein